MPRHGTWLRRCGGFLLGVLKSGDTGDLGQNLKSEGVFAIHHGRSAWRCSISTALLQLTQARLLLITREPLSSRTSSSYL